MRNIDEATAAAFDDKWGATYGNTLNPQRARQIFDSYFRMFPFEELTEAEGFELGCGQGRHAALVAKRVGRLHCIDPSPNGIAVAKRAMANLPNVQFHLADVDSIPLPEGSQDFGYSMGVLHHIPNTEAALASCTAKLKGGAPFLLYLYYDFENRPWWFRIIWRTSDFARRFISTLPFKARKAACDAFAFSVYWPLARGAGLLERLGANVEGLPLSSYKNARLSNMRVAALDRLGTGLERRFSRAAITLMMNRCGLVDVIVDPRPPYWVAIGRRESA